VGRDVDGAGDFFSPAGVAEEVLAEPLSGHGVCVSSVAGRASEGGVLASEGLNHEEGKMAKGYWITFYRSVKDANALSEYGPVARTAIEAGGGRFLARGVAANVYEAGVKDRTVLIEFDSLAQARATFEGPQYQAAAKLLTGKAERDVRIVEGV